jgi:hypothetical protein
MRRDCRCGTAAEGPGRRRSFDYTLSGLVERQVPWGMEPRRITGCILGCSTFSLFIISKYIDSAVFE